MQTPSRTDKPMNPPPSRPSYPPGRRPRCASLNYVQSLHQLMALSGDIMKHLEKRDTASSIETRVRVGAIRDAFYTDLLSLGDCGGLRRTLSRFGNALVSVVVARSAPTGGPSFDPVQAILIRMVQVIEEIPGLPLCPGCSC
ncbi:viral protein 7 [Tyulek (Tjuloc) virus]|uniref:Viral protein 7 n=1 Tax=Tyulek (Tjuloc) virus TaxID=1204161 RepID=A0A7T8IS61_9ORTO|nr:viral protein 7 [Tjuloc virus]QQO86211.1 viral protein 7 [Tjuloc virus]